MSIPKTIHYCWFGGNPLPELAQKCIASWKEYCPDYEIIEWNESNFDFSDCTYAREAYEAKKWAFVSDYARLKIIYEYGGIYLDTDVELLASLDSLLNNDCFMGIEKSNYIATGLGYGAIPKFNIIKELLDLYFHLSFVNTDGTFDLTPCPVITTDLFQKKGFVKEDKTQIIDNTTIYSSEYFCPLDYNYRTCQITENTISIHHYNASWLSTEEKYTHALYIKLLKHFSPKTSNRLSLMIGFAKFRGLLRMPKAMIDYKLNNLKKNTQE